MTTSRKAKRRRIIEQLRDPLIAANTDAAIARMFGVTTDLVASVRAEVEAEGAAFRKGSLHDIPIATIRRDGGTQPRANFDLAICREYRDDLKAGAVFPPISVVYDGTDHWVWDGFHRVKAAEMAGLATVRAEVRQGTRRDAVLLAAGANAGHGLRRTNGDKRRAVEHLLRDPEWVKWSNEEIARKCAVAPNTVRAVREELEKDGEINSANCRVGADGKTRDVTGIGLQPSTNGHQSQATPVGATTVTTDVTPPTDGQPAMDLPPMSPPVMVDHKVSVTLHGDPDEDFGLLATAYPKGALARLAQLIALELEDADGDEDDGDARCRPGPASEPILAALRGGPKTGAELGQINPRYGAELYRLKLTHPWTKRALRRGLYEYRLKG